jgi:hypothetical protein
MKLMKKIFFLLLVGLGIIAACKKKDDLNNLDCSKISSGYASNIKPIIEGNCLSSGCHNSGSKNGDFTTYEAIKIKVDNGSFNSRVIQEKDMPLSGSLSIDQLKKIKCWLNSGAPNN